LDITDLLQECAWMLTQQSQRSCAHASHPVVQSDAAGLGRKALQNQVALQLREWIMP
jgi:hypothetical protein